MRAVGVIDRGQKATGAEFFCRVDLALAADRLDHRLETKSPGDRRGRQAAYIAEACDEMRLSVANRDDPAHPLGRAMLEQL